MSEAQPSADAASSVEGDTAGFLAGDSKELVVSLIEEDEEEDNVTEASYDEDDGEENSQRSSASLSHMPLFHYRRVSEALPRTRASTTSPAVPNCLTKVCTAEAMGRLVLNAETAPTEESPASPPVAVGAAGSQSQQSAASASYLTRSWYNTELSLVAYGFETGDLVVADAVSTLSVGTVLSRPLASPVVALCWDSPGTNLGILTQNRVVTICADLKYSIQMRPVAQEQPPPEPVTPESESRDVPQTPPPPPPQVQAPKPNAFSSFMSAFTGRPSTHPGAAPSQSQANPPPPSASPERNHNESTSSATLLAPALTVVTSQLQIHRISYPESFGRPTCFAIDPAYKRRQNVVVGFADGRLVYTRRGFFRQRQDSIVYQGTADEVQAVAWRGSTLAFADASGIRLVDLDTMARIAHVDRPAGARPSLYPTVTDLRPIMTWETSSRLLVAWGDCLLSLQVRDAGATGGHNRSRSEITQRSSGVPSSTPLQDPHEGAITASMSSNDGSPTSASLSPSSGPSHMRRRTVECTMAWQLDCLACGVVALDSDRVVVLGLVPPSIDEEDESVWEREIERHGTKNEVELQVISRVNGDVVYADLIPVLRVVGNRGSSSAEDVASSFRISSSFAVPRMDDASEMVVLDGLRADADSGSGTEVADLSNPLSLFSTDSSRGGFTDSHLRWNMEMVSYEREDNRAALETKENIGNDTNSVDSDNYGIIFHTTSRSEDDSNGESDKLAVSPTMVIVTSNDVIQVRVRGADDAISFALSKRRAGLALFLGLKRRRQIRRYVIRDLVNAWFCAVLRQTPTLVENDDFADGAALDAAQGQTTAVELSPHLSLRRMKLAAEAMPILLGGDVDLWCRWIKEMERIPGALFIARFSLPVRDPILPKESYAGVLENMLEQIENMAQSNEEKETVDRLTKEAEGHFLNTLLSWGTIPILQEFIKLYKQQSELDVSFIGSSRTLEESLARRRLQSSSCYLQFCADSTRDQEPSELEGNPTAAPIADDSLFLIDDVLQMVSKRLSLTTPSQESLAKTEKVAHAHRMFFEAAAALEMMKGNFDEALRLFLLLGLHDPHKDLETIENEAVRAVNTIGDEFVPASRSNARKDAAFSYVLSVIEIHHLHQCLLSDRFLSSTDDIPPLFALVRLVGLQSLGDFLVDHCVAPQHSGGRSDYSPAPSKGSMRAADERRGTLPLDLVAQQFEASPKLLHWYLHTVFVRKPTTYVQFSSTANIPPMLNRLHRKHFDLYVKFSGSYKDSSVLFSDVEAYRAPDMTTPLLSFLKVVLQLGGIQPMEIAKVLQAERSKGSNVAVLMRSFALELAYILENFGEDGADESKLILELYLQGCRSLMLAVSYAQRTPSRSEQLWETLIDYCLSGHQQKPSVGQATHQGDSKRQAKAGRADGSLFGSLLEAAALSGADLAQLVQQIPPGMAVEGLRPRLVAAVADSRFKVQIQELARDIASTERMALVRELEHRSRRGVLYSRPAASPATTHISRALPAPPLGPEERDVASTTISRTQESPLRRTAARQDRYRLSFTIPIH